MAFYFEIKKHPDLDDWSMILVGDQCRVYKKDNFLKVISEINKYLQTINEDTCDVNDEGQYTVGGSEKEETFIKILDTYDGRTRIELPEILAKSIEGRELHYSYRSLQKFKYFWLNQWEDLPKLLKQLSEDIIEIPYADAPDEYIYRYERIVFHPNHGTADGLIHVMLFLALINCIYDQGDDTLPFNSMLKNMSVEEVSCLVLANFLFRCGRTNELGWKGDPSYGPRSAAIFKDVALRLGYDQTLVEAICRSFDFKETVALSEGFLNQSLDESNKKVKLYQMLFHIVHTLDLLKCNTDKTQLFEEVSDVLDGFFKDSKEYDDEIENLFSLTETLLQSTGAPIAYRITKTLYREGGENRYRQVDVVHKFESTFLELQREIQSMPWSGEFLGVQSIDPPVIALARSY